MKKWLLSFFHQDIKPSLSEPRAIEGQPAEPQLRLQAEIQGLQIQQQEDRRAIDNLAQENDRLKARQDQLVDIRIAQKLEALFGDLAAPASQILTQADLLENQGKPVQARDILLVARRMVRVLERHGLLIEGKVGETAAFDPEKHSPIQAGQTIQEGECVIIRFSGILFGENRLCKAIVERENACQED